MVKKIFISYAEADKKYMNKIRRWTKRGKCGSHKISVATAGDKAAQTKSGKVLQVKVRRMIASADLIIVLVGDVNALHPWRRYEAFAQEGNFTRYFMRIPYTDDPLPIEFKDMKQMAYNPNAIDKMFRDIFEEDEPKSDKDLTNNESSELDKIA